MSYYSCIADLLEKFENFRKAADHWCDESYGRYLRLFDRWLKKEYPENKSLTQDVIDRWCRKRDTEKNNSCRSRIYPLLCFLKYATNRGSLNIHIPEPPQRQRSLYIPHSFTDTELANFFNACDNMFDDKRITTRRRVKRMTVPVFFRLLLSSGMRTTEARLLRRIDVNLKTGVINICHSKGHLEHFVVLHDTMREVMQKYDAAMETIISNRTYFFESISGGCHHKDWVTSNFKDIWNKCNSSYAIPYELRHHYAVVNINNCIKEGFDFHSKFVYLSKSMGHKSLESTKYYYSLVPGLADIMDDLTNETMNQLLPQIDDEE
jgi:integrase